MANKKELRRARLNKFMVYFMALLMVSSVFGVIYFGFGSNDKYNYKGQKFYLVNNWWMTEMGKENLYFSYRPDQTEQIEVPDSVNLKDRLQIDMTYDVEDPFNETIALVQYRFQQRVETSATFVRAGQLTNTTVPLLQITCADATAEVPVIVLKKGNETSITEENNCIIVQSDSEYELVRYGDHLAFLALGIIE